MTDLKTQVSALLKKEYLLLTRTKNYMFQEFFGPLISLYFIWYTNTDIGKQSGFSFSPFSVALFLSRTLFGLTYNLVFEKSQNFKEYLRVNGASLYSYIFSVFIFNFIRAVIATTIMFTGLYLILGSEKITSPVVSYISLLIYALAILNFTLMMTTFFSSPKLATEVCSLIVLLTSFLYYGVSASSEKSLYYLSSLLPPIACLFSVDFLSGGTNKAGFETHEALIMQIANCFIYFLLYGWFDMVIPSDNGIKDPLFSCTKRSKSPANVQNELSYFNQDAATRERLLDGDTASGSQNQDISSAEHHEPFQNPLGLQRTVFVDQLTKVFDNNVAVDRVTIPMFERQIFCLLGHNGAGKTTTINMMTGMLRQEEGKIFYDGEDFGENFEKIRRKFGLCVQKDILYENLTAAEHIELVSRLRGVPVHEIPQYTTLLSQKVGIESELTKKTSTLSGGNKRKLSLALAIAGQTKVIFLDEPTSGMDPNARRNFWDIVRSLRDEGKTILLTTHSLDEADELADRIAVMSKGKLLVLGTSNYLKKKYGVGYNLILTSKPDTLSQFSAQKENLINQVKSLINHTELDSKTSPDMIKMILPYGESGKFSQLFEILEKEPSVEIALELNTLEDVFVNIGLQEEIHEAAQAGAYTVNTNENIPMPESINIPSRYEFGMQFSAMFQRKFYCTIRNRATMLQILFPILYVILCNAFSAQMPTETAQLVMFIMFSMVGFISNTNIYVAFPVIERENKVKYLLRTVGIRPLTYWLGTMCFDACILTTFALLLVPIGYLLNVSLVASYTGYFACAMVAFGFALVNQAYIFSWIYDKQATVYKFNILLALFGTVYAPLLIFGLVLKFNLVDPGDISTQLIIIIAICFLISPGLLLFGACLTLLGLPPQTNAMMDFFLHNTTFYICLMLLQAVMYFCINYSLETGSLRLKVKVPKTITPHTAPDFIPNPEEISQEEQRVRNPENKDLTKALDLGKVYENGFQALREISFGIDHRQIFGLLGPNGAGKSTTFNILTGLISKSSGQVYFNGKELEALTPEIFQNTGICPQFNALWDDLSLVEHLEIVGKVKGLDEASIHDAIGYYSKILRMEEHLNKKANQLSGGTKRKLCVANMLIASPVVQFLDEPSTGLDPLSKRALYDTITQNLEDRNASIILTTHSMSEAEALCTKIGILINGKFVCIGTLPYLKSRYGSGYKIAVVKQDSNREVYEAAIFEAFPKAVKENDQSEIYANYRVQIGDFSFAKAFAVMENLKAKKDVSDFNIINTTLEQVFIQFSRNQIQPPENAATST